MTRSVTANERCPVAVLTRFTIVPSKAERWSGAKGRICVRCPSVAKLSIGSDSEFPCAAAQGKHDFFLSLIEVGIEKGTKRRARAISLKNSVEVAIIAMTVTMRLNMMRLL